MRKQLVISLLGLILSSRVQAAVPRQLNAFSEGERLVYAKVVKAYRGNDLDEAKRQRNLLEKHYPNSIHLANAFYLTGVLEYQKNYFANAVRDFGVVADRYPMASKRPAAMYAKAAIYERLGLKPQSDRLLKILMKEYPGSQESQRAAVQLKVAQAVKAKAPKR